MASHRVSHDWTDTEHDGGRDLTDAEIAELLASDDAELRAAAEFAAAARAYEADVRAGDDDARRTLGARSAWTATPPPVRDAADGWRTACFRAALRARGVMTAARRALVAVLRAIADAVDTTIAPRLATIQSRARRAIAGLAGRLHGLIHTCLLAARVYTAQVAAVATG